MGGGGRTCANVPTLLWRAVLPCHTRKCHRVTCFSWFVFDTSRALSIETEVVEKVVCVCGCVWVCVGVCGWECGCVCACVCHAVDKHQDRPMRLDLLCKHATAWFHRMRSLRVVWAYFTCKMLIGVRRFFGHRKDHPPWGAPYTLLVKDGGADAAQNASVTLHTRCDE